LVENGIWKKRSKVAQKNRHMIFKRFLSHTSRK